MRGTSECKRGRREEEAVTGMRIRMRKCELLEEKYERTRGGEAGDRVMRVSMRECE